MMYKYSILNGIRMILSEIWEQFFYAVKWFVIAEFEYFIRSCWKSSELEL